ncbi:MAG: hypothetical protein AAGA20_22225 [Planctomycetota bacterium]
MVDEVHRRAERETGDADLRVARGVVADVLGRLVDGPVAGRVARDADPGAAEVLLVLAVEDVDVLLLPDVRRDVVRQDGELAQEVGERQALARRRAGERRDAVGDVLVVDP